MTDLRMPASHFKTLVIHFIKALVERCSDSLPRMIFVRVPVTGEKSAGTRETRELETKLQ